MSKTPEDWAAALVEVTAERFPDTVTTVVRVANFTIASQSGGSGFAEGCARMARDTLVAAFRSAMDQAREEAVRHGMAGGLSEDELKRIGKEIEERALMFDDMDRLFAHTTHLSSLLAVLCSDNPDLRELYRQGVAAGVELMRAKALQAVDDYGTGDDATGIPAHNFIILYGSSRLPEVIANLKVEVDDGAD